jgi:4-hydroxybenzoate polyprenyltransferase
MLEIVVRTVFVALGLWALILLLWMLARAARFPISEGVLVAFLIGAAGGIAGYFSNSVAKRRRNAAPKSRSSEPM